MFDKNPTLTPGAKKMAELTKHGMNKPAIRYGQGDKNNAVTFWYGKNNPKDQIVTSSK